MLGGLDSLSSLDLSQSEEFLREVDSIIGLTELEEKRHLPSINSGRSEGFYCRRAIDCGAGVGRVTGGLLVNYFDEVGYNVVTKMQQELY